jgi:hypothetical protein
MQIHVFLTSAVVGGEGVSFTPRPLYPGGKSSRYQLDRRLGGSQRRSARYGEVKILDPTGARTLTHPWSSQSLYRLRLCGCRLDYLA